MKQIKLGSLIFVGLLVIVFVALSTHSLIKQVQLNTIYKTHEINDFDMLTIDDYQVAFRQYGNPDHETLVLIHGFLGSGYDFRFISEMLEENFHIIAIDLVGFGHSEKSSSFSYTADQHSKIIEKLLEHLDIDHYYMLGHSMGARVALYHSYHHQNQMEGLILLSPADFNPEQNTQPPPKLFYDLIFKNYTVQRLAFFGVHHQEAYKSSDYFDPMYYFSAMIPSGVLQKMSNDQDDIDFEALMTEIRLDPLIITGAKDTWTPLFISENYKAKLNEAQLVIIEEVGHMPMIEAHTLVGNYIIDYINDE